MLVIHDAEGLGRAARERGRASGLGGVLVPTMGALHEGHASLIRRGAALAAEEALGECVVSIFVNPTQFNDASDFQRYPRTLEGDVAACEAAGASVVFAPDERTMYPSGDPGAAPVPPLPEVATRPGLEDA